MRCWIGGVTLLTLVACGDDPLDPAAGMDPGIAKGYENKGRILFAVIDGETDIYAMNADGTGQVNLTPGPWGGEDPDWSPRTRLIVFSDNRFGDYDIFVMREDGTGVTRLTSDPADEQWPAWSPDGRKIAFTSNADGDAEIHVMNADGSGAVPLTNNGYSDIQPAWSPDGSRIAFISFPLGWDDVAVMNADGSNLQNITQAFALNRFDPAWSPKGDRIALLYAGAGSGIQLIDPDGANPVLFDPTPNGDGSPAWSPDARQIAFNVSYGGGGCDIFRMNADGTTVTQLTFTGAETGVCNHAPDWYR